MHMSEVVDGKKKVTSLKLIDFEYSNYNFRGIDLASYINESTIQYGSDPKYKVYKEYFPSFEKHVEGTIDIDFMVKTYLENFYEKHLDTTIPEWEEYEKYATKETYVATEFPIMKEQLKSLVLFQDLYWVVWCLVMMKGSLINPQTNKIWEDNTKLQEMLAETNEFYTPYAKTRLD